MLTFALFNILPVGYFPTLTESFDSVIRADEYYYEVNDSKDYIVPFSGSYEECIQILQCDESLDTFKKGLSKMEIRISQEEISKNARDSEDTASDYFYTITDGQIGSYEDFEGDIDDIDIWSRR